MSFTYCQSCGHKNLYSVDPPKFCGECGTTLGSTTKARRMVAPKEPPDKSSEEWNEDGLEIHEVPHVEKLRYTVSHENSSARITSLEDLVPGLGELLEEDPLHEEPKQKRKRGRPRKKK